MGPRDQPGTLVGADATLAAGAGVRKQEAAGTAWVGGVGDGGTHGKSEPLWEPSIRKLGWGLAVHLWVHSLYR